MMKKQSRRQHSQISTYPDITKETPHVTKFVIKFEDCPCMAGWGFQVIL